MRTRNKGVRFEREVARSFEEEGFSVRGLESGGDVFVVDTRNAGRPLLHVECKRHERLRLPEWLEQMESDAPDGADRVLVFRQSRQRAYAVVPFDQYLRRLT